MIIPSPLVTTAAQLRILREKGCSVYLRTPNLAAFVDELVHAAPYRMTILTAPEFDELFEDTNTVDPKTFAFAKHWDQAMDDPWLVFHTSGTTGIWFVSLQGEVLLRPC